MTEAFASLGCLYLAAAAICGSIHYRDNKGLWAAILYGVVAPAFFVVATILYVASFIIGEKNG